MLDLHQHPMTKAVKNHVLVTRYWYVCRAEATANRMTKKMAAPRFGS